LSSVSAAIIKHFWSALDGNSALSIRKAVWLRPHLIGKYNNFCVYV
jgi:hypothetical protein